MAQMSIRIIPMTLRHEVVGTLALRVVEHLHLRHDVQRTRCGLHQLLPVGVEDAGGVVGYQGSLVGLGAVGNQLDGSLARREQAVGKAVAEHHHQAHVAPAECRIDVRGRGEPLRHVEIFAGIHALHDGLGLCILRWV